MENLFKAINSKRTISLPRFIYALGIRQVGAATALLLAQNYGTFEAFMTEMINKDTAKLVSIDGIGGAMAKDIVEFLPKNTIVKPFATCCPKLMSNHMSTPPGTIRR